MAFSFPKFKALARIPPGLRKVLPFGGVFFVVSSFRGLVVVKMQPNDKTFLRPSGMRASAFRRPSRREEQGVLDHGVKVFWILDSFFQSKPLPYQTRRVFNPPPPPGSPRAFRQASPNPVSGRLLGNTLSDFSGILNDFSRFKKPYFFHVFPRPPKSQTNTPLGVPRVDFYGFFMAFGVSFPMPFRETPKHHILQQVSNASSVLAVQGLPFWHQKSIQNSVFFKTPS